MFEMVHYLQSNRAGLGLDSITPTTGYSQMINEPRHFFNESSSCIDLIFSSNSSFVKNCESELSIYEICLWYFVRFVIIICTI